MNFWKRPKFIVWTLLLAFLVTVILQNAEPTKLRFLFWSFLAVPKLVLILASMLVGGLAALALRWSLVAGKEHHEDREDTNSEAAPPPTLH